MDVKSAMGSLSKAKGLFYFHTRHGDKECMTLEELSLELKSAGTFTLDDEVAPRIGAASDALQQIILDTVRKGDRVEHLTFLDYLVRAAQWRRRPRLQAYVPLFLTIHDSILQNPMQMQTDAK